MFYLIIGIKNSYISFIFCFRCLLKPNGILLPEKIFLIGQLVYSEDLPNMVYVQDVNLQTSSNTSICIDIV